MLNEFFKNLEEDINTLLWVWIDKVEITFDWNNGNSVKITLLDYSIYWEWICSYVFWLLDEKELKNHIHTITYRDKIDYEDIILNNKNY